MPFSIRRFLSGWLLEYETQKVVQIYSPGIAMMYRVTQLSIVLYIGLWVMWYQRGYQFEDIATSGVTSKVKGIAFANLTGMSSLVRVWDTADYVIPPQQNSAFFVMTNMVMTPNQTQTQCPEAWEVTRDTKNECESDANCRQGQINHQGSGVKTGRCVLTKRDGMKKFVCEIYGWCPVEDDRLPIPNDVLLQEVKNFTVLIKNNIEFPKYNVKRHNILGWMTKEFMQKCRYDSNHEKNRLCPIFRLQDILRETKREDPNVWVNGGIVSIQIRWECNLDWSVDYCLPEYIFRRLDDANNTPISKGWNLRYSHMYSEKGRDYRILIKAYGIQFFITVDGRGRKFDALTFTMNLGSGLGLLGMGTVVCDIIALNITQNRGIYRHAKVDKIATKKGDNNQNSSKNKVTTSKAKKDKRWKEFKKSWNRPKNGRLGASVETRLLAEDECLMKKGSTSSMLRPLVVTKHSLPSPVKSSASNRISEHVH